MSTYRELVYLILDEIKGMSDDFSFTEEHIIFLLDKYRVFLLKQRYSDIRRHIPEGNYQTICLNLEKYKTDTSSCNIITHYLKSKEKIPFIIHIGIPRVYPNDYFSGEISFISRDRMKYTGYNKYLTNIIYSSIGPDNHLYLKSNNPQLLSLENVKFTGVFQDSQKALELQCDYNDNSDNCDILDNTFPIEDSLIQPLVELVVKELTNSMYRPSDDKNNANDDLSNLQTSNNKQR